METVRELLWAYRELITLALLTLLLLVVIWYFWSTVRLFLMSAYYRLPLVGKTARLSRDLGRDGRSGWFKSERALCHDFYTDLRKVNPDPRMYRRARSYLSKAHEDGRKEMGPFAWIMIATLVFIEALGFAFVLAGRTVPGTSQYIETNVAFGVALIISIVLVWATHSAGRSLHKRQLVNLARDWWPYETNRDGKQPLGRPDNRVKLETDERDDDKPAHEQLINRVNFNGRAYAGIPWMIITAAILVIFIGSAATGVRVYAYYANEAAETQNAQAMEAPESGSTSGTPGDDIFGSQDSAGETATPEAVRDSARASENAAFETLRAAETNAAYLTYAVLFVVYLGIQFIGMSLGYSRGFAGKASATAYSRIKGFASEDEYLNHFEAQREKVAGLAQGHLDRLQAKMYKRARERDNDDKNLGLLEHADDRTFEAFAAERDAAQRGRTDEHKADAAAAMQPSGDGGDTDVDGNVRSFSGGGDAAGPGSAGGSRRAG